ncbi:MAG TPA: sulfite exporter TauE/SafE family protein [Polyangiaceae bacterium]
MTTTLLLPALLMGLLGSTHCVFMCGGIVGMTCSALPAERRLRLGAQLPYLLTYNLGRIISYAVFGAVAGAVGAAVASVGVAERAQLLLRLVAGTMMVAVGLYVAGFAPAVRWIERVGEPAWRRIAPLARRLVPVRTPVHSLALGLLWGAMPCGLVYAAMIAAVTSGSALSGAATMLAFGMGTLPMLLAMGSVAAATARALRTRWVRPVAGVVLVALGALQVVHVGQAWATGAHACCAAHVL